MLSAKRAFTEGVQHFFHNFDLSRMSRLRYYTVYVLSVLTYACETWSLSAAQLRRLEGVQSSFLKRIFKFWCFDDKVSYLDVLLLSRRYGVDILCLEIQIAKRRLIFLGSCERMESNRMCHQLLHSDLEDGRRSQGSRNTFRSCVKKDLQNFGLFDDWKNIVHTEKKWLEAVDKGSLTYFRKWVIQKYHKKFYKRGEITEKGREIKSLSEEMVNSMKVFPERRTDSSFMVTKKNKRLIR